MEKKLMLVIEVKRNVTTIRAKNSRLKRVENEQMIAMKGTPAAIAKRNTRYFIVAAMIS